MLGKESGNRGIGEKDCGFLCRRPFEIGDPRVVGFRALTQLPGKTNARLAKRGRKDQ